jgi:hypothetical protein
MRKYLLPLVGLAVVGYFLIRRSTFANNIQVVLKDIALRGTITRPRINVTLGIQNPTNSKATIKSILGNVLWNDQSFANVSSFKTIEILPNAESTFVVETRPDLLGASGVIVDIFRKGFKGGVIKFEGTINVNNINLPLNVTKNV